MTNSRYVAIEGVIGVGKTTLARYLSQDLDAGLLLEVFEENPFLADFYVDRQQYAFQTQVFFLLSRYRHQHQQIPRLMAQSDMVSDYTFAKDSIFAQVNLVGDEYDTYSSLHQELAENIVRPDLIVYLDADIETILQRIAIRDRSYERQIEPDYLAMLARAYEAFLSTHEMCPVLIIDTSDLDIVRNLEHRAQVIRRIRSALGAGTHQPALLDPGTTRTLAVPAHRTESETLPPVAMDTYPEWASDDATSLVLELMQRVGQISGALSEPEEMAAALAKASACLAQLASLTRGQE